MGPVIEKIVACSFGDMIKTEQEVATASFWNYRIRKKVIRYVRSGFIKVLR